MRIAVLGAGAMGSWFGGQLARGGSTVQLLTTNVAHVNAIRQSGLQLHKDTERCSVAIPAHTPEQIDGPVDLVLLFTKSYQSKAALSAIAHAIDDNTCVMSLQNGLGNAETIASYVAEDRILIGVTLLPVDKISPGVVACKGEGPSYFGPAFSPVNDKLSARISEILTAFEATDLKMTLDPAIHRRIWEKVAFNAGMNSLAALSHGTPGAIGESVGAKELTRDVATEVASVASATGVEIDLDRVFSNIDYACANHTHHKPSMLQDLNAKKPTEIDALCAAIVRIGEQQHVPTPLNAILTTLVKLAELSHQKYQ